MSSPPIYSLHAIGLLFLLLQQMPLHLGADGKPESSLSWTEGSGSNKTVTTTTAASGRLFHRHGPSDPVPTTYHNSPAEIIIPTSTLLGPPNTTVAAVNHSHGHRHNMFRSAGTTIHQSNSEGHTMARMMAGDEPLEPPQSLPSSSRIIGPYFETNLTSIKMTVRAGQHVLMDCSVVLLQGRTVSWLRQRKLNIELLTVGNATYSADSRLALHFRYPNNWRLGITNVNKRDEGDYRCQLSTHPIKTLTYHLRVIAPAVLILDENGKAITERHYKEDSSLHLTCKASHLDGPADKVSWYKGDRSLPGGDSRIKVKLSKNSTNGESSAYLSVLSVRRRDSGNYTCRASPTASNTIAVHVLNGELPAAVQHENHGSNIAPSFFLGLLWSLFWTAALT